MKTNLPPRLRHVMMLASCLAVLPTAQAHSVWIEDSPGPQLVVRFGEPGDEYEKSPGHLDNLTLPAAWQTDGEGKPMALAVEKKTDHFLLVGAPPVSVALAETRFPVFKRGTRPASWPQFYVRWHPRGAPVPAAPALTLDILPTGTPGEFRVFFRGQPLPGAKIGVEHLGTGTGEELTADAEGLVRYQTDAAGLVLLLCNHKEQTPGFTGGLAYEVVSHNTALTWRQP